MPAPAPAAVFLSYASQDAAAAQRVCDALRAAGIEVWFDLSELRGGDAWDKKIRTQIRDCALFLPIISANTQARLEGYFRLEWKLAEDRSHLMAKGKPFLVPVVVDDTSERDAQVPDAFLAVQWTRLPAGETSAAFCAQVQRLLGLGVAPVSDRRSEAGRTTNAGQRPALPQPTRRPSPLPAATWSLAAIAVLVIAGYFFSNRSAPTLAPAKSPEPIAPNPSPAAAPAAADKSLVVLPLENLSPDPNNAFFTEGMHAEIIAALQAVPELKVLSREAALALKAAGGSVRELARQAGVAHVLSGSVRRDGTKVRLLLDLRRASDDVVLWSAPKVTHELKDTLALQAEVAEEVARVLRARFDKGAFAGLRFLATDPRAYDAYLKAHGQYQQNLNRPPSILKAVALMEEGMTFDPKFMPGARLLGRMYVRLYSIESVVAQREKYADDAKRWSELASALVPGGAGDTALAIYSSAVELGKR